MTVLGMDLGQSKSAWETLDTQTGEVARGQVRMNDDALRKLLVNAGADQLVIESGPLAARVHDPALGTRPANTSPNAYARRLDPIAARSDWMWSSES